ncbi:ferric reductase-like transmembrane domain-containing protein [Thermostaphylospora chromogena]|uniref:Ferric reductase like transmembrane component n=1 Tax=Thermostaphylospora chromogena TaxID=35622 RepID=A0A1H1GCI9_9ACTN|nr:Ferric reductase like transmembrane component [Thermostaphylospora chromogena]
MTGVRKTRRTRWFDVAALGRDIRAAALDATVALVITLALFVWFYQRVASGSSPTIQVMPFLADADEYRMYWLCQAFGWSALLWAWITVMLGLIRSSRRPAWLPVATVRIEKWHRTTSLTTIALMFGHAFWFFAETVRYNEDGLGWGGRLWSAFVEAFVPGGYASGTGRIAILIGLLAFYLSIPLGLAFYTRRSIGGRVWRVLHGSIIVVYVLSVWHTLLYGTNLWYDGWFRTTVWLLQLPVAALLLVRLLAPAYRPGSSRLDLIGRVVGRSAAAATIVVLLAVAISGRDGGRTPGVEGAGLNVTQAMVWIGFAVFLVTVAAAVYRAWRLAPAPGSGREEAGIPARP